ncbi:hypothetical protein NGUA07_03588 [Salmonella enterica]|nr:hypothetical protein NGUA07_03588 [Salmonella enterica]
MVLANEKMRERLEKLMNEAQTCTCCSDELKALFTEWIENKEDVGNSRELAEEIVPMVNACECDLCKKIEELSNCLVKRNQ